MKKAISTIGYLWLLSGTAVFADVVELPLNCAGTYDVNTPAWTTDFDLGVSFSKISHVYVNWSGEMNASLYQGSRDPNLVPIDGSLIAGIGSIPGEGWLRRATVMGGESTYPDPEPFDIISEFLLLDTGANWNSLLDGKDTVTIVYPAMVAVCSIIYQGSAVLNNSTLIVEGTVIPEPATIMLLGTAGIWVLTRKNKSVRLT